MKILWICNVPIPLISKILGDNVINSGGWLDGASQNILKNNDVKLYYCYPEYNKDIIVTGKETNFAFWGIPMTYSHAVKSFCDSSSTEKYFEQILNDVKPDIIHFWGSEFLYSYKFYKVAQKVGLSNRCVCSIQGLVSKYALHLNAGLPATVIHGFTLSELKNSNNIYCQIKSFERRGKSEEKFIKELNHVIGRTSWDKACVSLLNSNINYHFCNESLRYDFYSGAWKYNKCNKRQIFISQASYPIKGFHTLIKAVKYIYEYFPDIKVKVAGGNIFDGNWIKGNSYGIYIRNMIKRYHLGNVFEFLGNKNAMEMKELLLSSNIFISPSSIENSPNSLGEAMLLGVPCIASNVGGVADLLVDEKEGYLYPFNEPYKLAYYIKLIFDMKEKSEEVGMMAKTHAQKTHDSHLNNKKLCDIYRSIINSYKIMP